MGCYEFFEDKFFDLKVNITKNYNYNYRRGKIFPNHQADKNNPEALENNDETEHFYEVLKPPNQNAEVNQSAFYDEELYALPVEATNCVAAVVDTIPVAGSYSKFSPSMRIVNEAGFGDYDDDYAEPVK